MKMREEIDALRASTHRAWRAPFSPLTPF